MKSRGMAPRDESWEAEGRTRKRGRRSLWFWPVLYGAAFSIELLLAASSRRRTVSARPPRCRRRHDAIGSAVSYFSPHSPIGPRPRAKPARIRLDRVHCERPQRWPAPTAHLCRCVGQRARLSLSLSLCRCVCVSAPLCVCVYLRARGVCGQQLSSKSCFTLLFRPTAVAGLSSLAPRPQSCVFYYCRGTKRDAKRRHPCTKTITTAGQDMESAPFETTASGSVHLHGYDSISVG